MKKPKILKSLFLAQRYNQTFDGVTVVGKRSLAPVQWIVGRDLCLYQLISLTGIPQAERNSALALQIEKISPFAEPGSHTIAVADNYQVWIWDERLRETAAQKQPVTSAKILPETVLLPMAKNASEVCLRPCLRGIDVQIWKDGILMASRWWKQTPQDKELQYFLQVNDYNPDTSIASTVQTKKNTVTLLETPWGHSSSGMAPNIMRYQNFGIKCLWLLLSFFLVWQITTLVKWQEYKHTLQAETEQISFTTEPILAARSMALNDLAKTERIANLAPYPSLLEIWAAMIQTKVGKDATIRSWHYTNGQLSFTLSGKAINPTFNVKAFVEHPFFKDVTMEKGNKLQELNISMKVRPWHQISQQLN